VAYCTQADLEATIGAERLAELSDFERAGGGVNAARVEAACVDASALIDSYAAKHFAVPFATPSAVIRRMAIRLALYDLIEQRPNGPTEAQLAEQTIRLQWLQELAAGKVHPGTTPSPPAHTMNVDQSVERPITKDVSRARTKGYW
jgi:phage gp36-like protein